MIRLWVGALGIRIVSHEIQHAATAIYGSTLPKRISRRILDNANETFAHIHSDLEASLIDRLYALGAYEPR